jgi:hypothetical protein
VPREHLGQRVELAELVLDRAAPHERAFALLREDETLELQLVQRLPNRDAAHLELLRHSWLSEGSASPVRTRPRPYVVAQRGRTLAGRAAAPDRAAPCVRGA